MANGGQWWAIGCLGASDIKNHIYNRHLEGTWLNRLRSLRRMAGECDLWNDDEHRCTTTLITSDGDVE